MYDKEIYNRTEYLRKRINQFLHQLTGNQTSYYDALTQEELINLKMALSDVNNVLTLRTTLSFTIWLCNFFNLTADEKLDIHNNINKTKPNTNGYDIEINDRLKIVAEIKCIVPINEGSYYGAAQRNAILDDAIKLKTGKKVIKNTTDFIKIIGLIDLGKKTDQAIEKLIKPSSAVRTEDKNRILRHEVVHQLTVIEESMKKDDLTTNRIYIKKI
jgi:hypothetical protein